MSFPIDGDSRVSEKLSARMESLLTSPDIEEPITLGLVAPAIDFTAVKASQELSCVIETLVDDSETDTAPTPGAVREAMNQGLLARLVGDGTIDRYGQDTLAEQLLRFE